LQLSKRLHTILGSVPIWTLAAVTEAASDYTASVSADMDMLGDAQQFQEVSTRTPFL
jgi:hypothetical protein